MLLKAFFDDETNDLYTGTHKRSKKILRPVIGIHRKEKNVITKIWYELRSQFVYRATQKN